MAFRARLIRIASKESVTPLQPPLRTAAAVPRLFFPDAWLRWFISRIVAFRCRPVVLVNSSSIFVFSTLPAFQYLSLIALAYSAMLVRVTVPPWSFGNTNFEATTSHSVTFVMSQCGDWDLRKGG